MLHHPLAGGANRPARLPDPAARFRWHPASVTRRAPSGVVLTLASLLLLSLLVAWLADGSIVRLLLDQAAIRAADEVQLGVLDRITRADFDPPFDTIRMDDLAARLDPIVERLRGSHSDVLRINVIARDGTILYSDLAPIRGRLIPLEDKPELQTALGGGIGQDDSILDSQENSDLRPAYGRALEVYIPVRIDGQVTGAYEIYESVGQLRTARFLVWGGWFASWCLAAVAWYTLRRRGRASPAQMPSIAPVTQSGLSDGDSSFEAGATVNAERDWRIRLTPRELEVLRLMVTSHTNRDIAEQLGVSQETVRSHVKRILHKLDKPDRTQAVLAAVRAGLIDLP